MRLDADLLEKLERTAAEDGVSVAEVARRFLGVGYEDWMKERRREAVRRIAEANIEDMPDPEELSKQLASTYDIDLP